MVQSISLVLDSEDCKEEDSLLISMVNNLGRVPGP